MTDRFVAKSPTGFDNMMKQLYSLWLQAPQFDRGGTHAQARTSDDQITIELRDLRFEIKVPYSEEALAHWVKPNLPWANDHFAERVSGEPLNPPPAEAWWPYAQQGNEVHKDPHKKFSHTYPERFWPKVANASAYDKWLDDQGEEHTRPHQGIRFVYGDLNDLVKVLIDNPLTRQAYLPVWFPEDLTAAKRGLRVPCTLGYHFMMDPEGKLNMNYYMRSCDLVRFFRDDLYMAGCLLIWVVQRMYLEGNIEVMPGNIIMSIASLHAFEGDRSWIQSAAGTSRVVNDPRASYNFDGLL